MSAEALVKLLLPGGMRSGNVEERYPLILRVYAGPGSQMVTEAWSIGFDHFLASSRGIIVALVDGRGSGGRGWKYRAPLYHDFAHYEILDQIAVIRYTSPSSFVPPLSCRGDHA